MKEQTKPGTKECMNKGRKEGKNERMQKGTRKAEKGSRNALKQKDTTVLMNEGMQTGM